MFALKKLISAFLLPLPAAFILMAGGLVLLWFTSRQRAGKILTTAGFAVMLVGCLNLVADGLLGPLEDRHPPLYPRERLEAATTKAGKNPRWIVVLGAAHVHDMRLPPQARLNSSALARLSEGVRLLRELPEAKLLLSGGVGPGIRHGEALAAAARALGVAPESMEVDLSAWDTEQEAENIAGRIGKADFILVTSASHMPRALALFRKRGTAPIPAPTHHLSSLGVNAGDLWPGPGPMHEVHTATHEYIGFLWSRLRGRL